MVSVISFPLVWVLKSFLVWPFGLMYKMVIWYDFNLFLTFGYVTNHHTLQLLLSLYGHTVGFLIWPIWGKWPECAGVYARRPILSVGRLCVLETVTVDETSNNNDSDVVLTHGHAQLSWSQFDVCACFCVCWFPVCCLQVMSAPGEPRLSLDLKPKLNYTVHVRCSSPDNPPLWSDWSEPHRINLESKNHSRLCRDRYIE